MSYIFKPTLDIFIVYSKCSHEYKKILKEEDSIEILKILCFITNVEEHHKLYNHV